MIPFNKPYLTGKETHNIYQAVYSGKISGNGEFTRKCHAFFEEKYNFAKTLLTSSCTDALEMSAILLNITPGDEVIMPSFTFVSTANAFVLRGANIVFADCETEIPNIDVSKLEDLITPKTKAIVPVHYAGIACRMDEINQIAKNHNLYVVEDAAQAIQSSYKGKQLGTLGDLSTFSFHETKNIISGEGGMLCINNTNFIERAEVIWEKGTNRAAFFRGETSKYSWVDVGSSFLPSELVAAFLYAQLEHIDEIQQKRLLLWKQYEQNLKNILLRYGIKLPIIPEHAENNAHIFFMKMPNKEIRDGLINFLKNNGILSVFHYLPLHLSPFYVHKHDGRTLSNTESFSDTIIRLPLFFELTEREVDYICEIIITFCRTKI